MRISRFKMVKQAPLALAAGLLQPLGFAPFGWWPLALLGLGVLFYLWRSGERAIRLGWWFGVGQFGFGVAWLSATIEAYGGIAAPLAWLGVAALVAVLALFPAAAGGFQQLMRGSPMMLRLVLIMPVAYLTLEWARGWVLSGLPWLSLGYAFIDTPLAHLAPLGGLYAVSWAALLSVGLALAVFSTQGAGRIGAGLGLVLLWGLTWQVERLTWTQPSGPAVPVALVQSNLSIQEKWRRAPTAILEEYWRLSRTQRSAQLVVWPEVAITQPLDTQPEGLRRRLVEHPADFVFGTILTDGDKQYNTLVALRADAPPQRYLKRKLVPFGEYLPWRSLTAPLLRLTGFELYDFAPGPANQPPIEAGGLRLAVSICYEDVFPRIWHAQVAGAGALINVNEDGWFGDSLAPHQRLQMARMRAREAERPLLRSTNTGPSALIDWRGRVVQRTPLFERTVLTGRVEPRRGLTPYVRFGNGPVLWVAWGMLGVGLWLRRRKFDTMT